MELQRLALLLGTVCAHRPPPEPSARGSCCPGGSMWFADTLTCGGGVRGALDQQGAPGAEMDSFSLSQTTAVRALPGEALELPCGNDSTRGLVHSWQTPFGRMEDSFSFGRNDPIQPLCDGSLQILQVTASHSGLYYCLLLTSKGRAIISYRLRVAGDDHINRHRRSSGAEGYAEGYSESHFVAAVTSSVLVTFLGAFTLGVLSRSHLIKCLSRVRARISRHPDHRSTADDTSQISTNNSSLHYGSVIFSKNVESESTVHIVSKPSPPKAPRSFRLKREEHEDGAYLEGCGPEARGEEQSQSDRPEETGNESSGDITGSEEAEDPGTHEVRGQSDSEERDPPVPKRRSRVIKLYNYDEDGNQYSHIKETRAGEEEQEVEEGKPRPKQRALSLTRLNAIMTKAASLDSTPRQDQMHADVTPRQDQTHTDATEAEESPRDTVPFQMDI